ncbi:hypothetical protein [Niabella aurantiaca]|uniref:hypothetical protein n=1 Tax=Niabella aurantiaca TaxID=379900 RepID=UPI00037172CA|nr:hypothetical protein [Niabella aurantiaca]
MKDFLICAILLSILLQGCSAVEAIFKAGMWWAFFLVGVVILAVFLLLRRK